MMKETGEAAAMSANAVADYLLMLADDDSGEGLSNLKLQKLLYYAHGIHLALSGKPLFPDTIQAWQHGPVVISQYHRFKEHGSNPIPIPEDADISSLNDAAKESINEAWTVYGQFSGWRLREMTHSEPPWKNAITKLGKNISDRDMRDYFRTRLTDGEEE